MQFGSPINRVAPPITLARCMFFLPLEDNKADYSLWPETKPTLGHDSLRTESNQAKKESANQMPK